MIVAETVVLCPCAACSDLRGDLYHAGERMCFADQMAELGDNGHGPCVDPWGQGCTCTGTAADGECEGCWLWLK